MEGQHLEGSGTHVDVAVHTPAFLDASLRLVYTFKIMNRINLDLSSGISNIFNSCQNDFDLGYLRDSGYIYGPSQPRAVSEGVTLGI